MIAAVVGAVFGSFLNVVAYRLPRGESLSRPRSRCPRCETPIRPYDNVPVLSWLALRGRCRSCRGAIPWRYPLVEAMTGLLCALVVLDKGLDEDALLGLALVLLLIPVTLIDLDHRIIPNRLTYPAFLVFAAAIVLAWLVDAPVDPVSGAIGVALYGGFLFIVALISPKGMGLGDVKLTAVIGLVLGSIGLRFVGVAAGAAIVLGGVGGIVALAMGRSRKDAIPFGPYIAVGAVVGGLWGEPLAAWYLDRFL